MPLYRCKKNKLTPIDGSKFKLEKGIQSLIEGNMDTLFGLRFVSSEFTVGNYRIDSLGFDEENRAFVIVEYKNKLAQSVVDQGFSYLATMLDRKADFILKYNEKTGDRLGKNDIDWSASRVIFISPSFTESQKDSVNFSDIPFELWEIKKFDGELVSIDQCHPSSRESIKTLAKNDSRPIIKKVSAEVKVFSEEDRAKDLSAAMKPLWAEFRGQLEAFGDTSFGATRHYVSCKKDGATVCRIGFPKKEKELRVTVGRGYKKVTGETSRDFFTLDDPKKVAAENSWKWQSGDTGHEYVISLKKSEELDYVMFLVKQKYDSMG